MSIANVCRVLPLAAVLSCSCLTPGCSGLNVAGSLRGPRWVWVPGVRLGSGEEPWGGLLLGPNGELTLEGNVLDVPRAEEHRRFGVQAVDLAALPAQWRPAYARDGGVMIVGVTQASPLAVAGLRPFHVVRQLDGEPVTGPEDLMQRLEAVEVGREIELTLSTSSGDRSITAPVVDAYRASSEFNLPLLYSHKSSRMDSHLKVLGFVWQNATTLNYDQFTPFYLRTFTWTMPLGLVKYEHADNLDQGTESSTLTVFHFFEFDVGNGGES